MIGVAMVAGTFMLTDTLQKSFSGLFTESTENTDAVVRGKEVVKNSTSGEVLALLRESVDALGQTTVMVTHDAHAAAIADRVLFLADGMIVCDLGRSTAHEILDTLEAVTAR